MTNSMIRPAWTPVTIAMMVLGFIIAWPLGLAMLAYIIVGDRLEGFKKDVNRATDKVADTSSQQLQKVSLIIQDQAMLLLKNGVKLSSKRIEDERRKMDKMHAEFDEYQRELRRARDKEEFDEFLKSRKRKPAPRSKKSGGDVIDT